MSSLVSDVFYINQLSELKELSDHFLIFDKHLLTFDKAKQFIDTFTCSYAVEAGESLKDLSSFPQHMDKILEASKSLSFKNSKIIVMGGGTVGDFGGFVASTLKRGVPLIHIPTTWLAAIDSSHGGKTALNSGSYKNQIGSFYKAEKILIIKELLESNPESLKRQAWGEAFKMLLISIDTYADKNLWEQLPGLVEEKYKWVEKDPYEKLGDRQVLNLGHTLGHAFEVMHRLPHGWAVGQGLHFSLIWSEKKFDVDLSIQKKALERKIPMQQSEEGKSLLPLAQGLFKNLLLQDKKKVSHDEVNFVFINKSLKPEIKPVSFVEIMDEAIRQGWVEK